MNNKEKIVETAIMLFNEQGTKAVTTNHIAAAAGISPGNLYYHFKDKKAIIREIFDRMDAYGQEEYKTILKDSVPGTVDSIERTFVLIQEFNWRFRFFKRELLSLVMDDPVLKERYKKTHTTHLSLIKESIDLSIRHGILKQIEKHEKDLLADEVWLIALFWLNYLEISGLEVTRKNIRKGNELISNILSKYFKE